MLLLLPAAAAGVGGLVPRYKSSDERAVLELLFWGFADEAEDDSSWGGRMLEWSVRPDNPNEVWLRRSSDLELRS